MRVREMRGSQHREDAGQDGDGLVVLGEIEVLVGGVVQAGIAGAVGENGTLPAVASRETRPRRPICQEARTALARAGAVCQGVAPLLP